MTSKYAGLGNVLVEQFSRDPEFVAEMLALEFTEEVAAEIERRGENNSWLADQLGVSRQRISHLMSGAPNMTLLSIARIAVATGFEPTVHLDKSQCRYGSAVTDGEGLERSVIDWHLKGANSTLFSAERNSSMA